MKHYVEQNWNDEEDLDSIASGNNEDVLDKDAEAEGKDSQKYHQQEVENDENTGDTDRTVSETESSDEERAEEVAEEVAEAQQASEEVQEPVIDLPNGDVAGDNNFSFKIVNLFLIQK
jgi:hypothetical protein